jgi:hypothetical protein
VNLTRHTSLTRKRWLNLIIDLDREKVVCYDPEDRADNVVIPREEANRLSEAAAELSGKPN